MKSNSYGVVRGIWLALLLMGSFVALAKGQNATAVTLTIAADKVENAISGSLYGQFAEFMFQDIKGGLDAELVRDRGFDEQPNALGLPRYWERDPDDRNDDGALHFAWDADIYLPVNGDENTPAIQHSLRVDVHSEIEQRRGIRQGWFPVRAGIDYEGYVWLKSADYVGRVVIKLESDRTEGEEYARAVISDIAGDWKKYSFTLRPAKSDPLAKLAILFQGKGRVWLDQVSLLPGDSQGGIRHDVEQRVAALHPAFIRWPGGNVAQDYHWKWGVGQRDHRPLWVNESWGNELEPSNFGTNEFIQFARRVKAEPSITVNVEGRGATAEEAAAWVEYCNGDARSKYGSLRAANGSPEAFHVRYWEIGNEIWGDWVRGHSDAQTYAKNVNRYVEKMRAVDPSIKIIATGDNNLKWNETVLTIAGKNIDYLSVHHYYGLAEMKGDADNLRARPLHYEQFYLRMKKMFQELVPGHKIELAINEWNTTLPLPAQHSMQSAVYAARLMNVFERSGDVVQMSAVSDIVNGWTGGIIQASRHGVYVTPTYLVNQLYASHLGTERLTSTLRGPTFDSTLEGVGVPTIDVVATRSKDGRQIFIKVVNTDPSHAVPMEILVNGVRIAPQARLETLNSNGLSIANDFAHPDLVRITESTVKTSPFITTVREHSVSIITVNVE